MSERPEPASATALYGHVEAASALAAAIRSGRLPQAWLIEGPRGVGKATLAYRFARSLLAGTSEPDLAVSPDSPVFRQIAGGQHPDFHKLVAERKTAKSRLHIDVDKVHDILERLHETVLTGGRKVLLVDAADDLALGRGNSANAMLKLIEEPPGDLVCILVSHRAGALPKTIASRCARLRLKPLQGETLERALRSLLPTVDAAERALLADLCGGAPGRAVALHESGWIERYRAVLSALTATGSSAARTQAAADLLSEAFPQAEDIGPAVDLVRSILHRALLAAVGRSPALPLDPQEPERLRRLLQGRPLDRQAALWEKLGALSARADALNLDRPHAYLLATGLILGQGDTPTGSPPGAGG